MITANFRSYIMWSCFSFNRLLEQDSIYIHVVMYDERLLKPFVELFVIITFLQTITARPPSYPPPATP